jgi:hypothetical protein
VAPWLGGSDHVARSESHVLLGRVAEAIVHVRAMTRGEGKCSNGVGAENRVKPAPTPCCNAPLIQSRTAIRLVPVVHVHCNRVQESRNLTGVTCIVSVA